MRFRLSRPLSLFAAAVLALFAALTGAPPAEAVSPDLVISQVYGGYGSSGAVLQGDYVELFNRGTAAVDITGWSLQYTSATGSTWGNQKVVLAGTVAPGRYYLVHLARGTGGTPLPPADATGSFNISASNGKLALVRNADALSGNCPSDPDIADMTGYGTADCGEGGTKAPAPSATTAIFRAGDGCTDTDNSAADFAAATPAPRNSGSPSNPCGGEPPPPPPPEPAIRIRDIQGAAHTSALAGQTVTGITGIVTAVKSNGFYMQDPEPDTDPATSEAIFVFKSGHGRTVGDAVSVSGRVDEYRPGGDAENLTITQLGGTVTVTRLSAGNPVPAATVIGPGGRMPPQSVIDDDSLATFDPESDGLDFWESLESMLVEVRDAVAVGPTNRYGEVPVVPDGGATIRTPRGGVVTRADDFNPERIFVDDVLVRPTPDVHVGDRFGHITGIVDYSFANFKLQTVAPLTATPGGLTREVATPAGPGELAIATFNVENLDPGDPAAKFDGLAALIVANLQAPDLIALEEVQDNNGAANDSVVDAAQTYSRLIAAIESAGGPSYQFRQVDPVDDQDGGEPGGNIRVGFLFRTDRGLQFVDRPGAGSTTANEVLTDAEGAHLRYSPGRIDPSNPAFAASRKPLAGEFRWQGRRLIVIANHFSSKNGDEPLFGSRQPPRRSSEAKRHQQAGAVAAFVSQVLAADPGANVVVLGDLNDFHFAATLEILRAAGLYNPMESLPEGEAYTYVFEGNSQSLDHLLLSSNLYHGAAWSYDIVHVNAEFHDQLSDHDPQVIRLTLNQPPTAGAGGPYTADEGGSVTLTATGTDPEGQPLTYAWDLDGDGAFESPGQSALFSAAGLDGPATRTVSVRATDPAGLSHTAQAEVRIRNVAPTAAVSNSGPAPVGAPVTVTFADATDPSAADVAAGFAYAIACDGGALAYGLSPSATCSFALPGTYTILSGIRDKDGDATEYTTTVTVTASPDGGGSVTGGGWISLGGRERANIVVTARNICRGTLGQVAYDAPDLRFRSTALDWLVVRGDTAWLQGTGTLGGSGEYAFLLAAAEGDGGRGGGRVRIKIWNKADGSILVDTQPGAPDGAAPATALGGGAIQVREK